MYKGLQCLISISLALIVKSQNTDPAIDPQVLCSPCKNRGSCDVPVLGECTQYYSCRMVDNNWYYVKMNCAHGTHFSEASGGCLKPEDANCVYDPCANKTSGFYKLEGFCRSYWECKSRNLGGISEAHCCPVNQTFSPEGRCVDDPTCDNFEECTTLPGEGVINDVVCPEGRYGAGCRYTCSEHCIGTCDSLNGECSLCAKGWMGSKCMEECTYKSVPDNIYLYMEDIGETSIKRACGLGTMFNQDKCICDKDPNYVINKECKPDVEIAFESGNRIKNTIDWKWIGGQFRSSGETVPLGGDVYKVGRFDGMKSNLFIPFYNRNTEMRKQFATEILFNPDNGKGEKEQILLSNCQSANNKAIAPFEIKLLKDTQDIQISLEGVPTDTAIAEPSSSFSVTMKYKPDDWNKLEVVFNGAKSSLTARNMDLSGGVISEGSTAVQNFLENGLDLRIGGCPEKGYFVGKMAMVRTYLCEPQFELGTQPAAGTTGNVASPNVAPADVAPADVAPADVAADVAPVV